MPQKAKGKPRPKGVKAKQLNLKQQVLEYPAGLYEHTAHEAKLYPALVKLGAGDHFKDASPAALEKRMEGAAGCKADSKKGEKMLKKSLEYIGHKEYLCQSCHAIQGALVNGIDGKSYTLAELRKNWSVIPDMRASAQQNEWCVQALVTSGYVTAGGEVKLSEYRDGKLPNAECNTCHDPKSPNQPTMKCSEAGATQATYSDFAF